MSTDTRIHVEKTVSPGLSLAFGKTVGTGCGVRRDLARVSIDPAKVTCNACRIWAAQQELEWAGMAEAAASLPADFIDTYSVAVDSIWAQAKAHRLAAEKWSSK